jgi:hypothetical protein
MEEHDLLEFAAGFGDVGAWRGAMLARGYGMPLQLCHGLSQAMKHLNLTFPQAFRLFWDKGKILVSGHSLIYDLSASKLWTAGPPLQDASPSGPLVAQAVESPPKSGRAREPRQSSGLGSDCFADALERGPGGHPEAPGHEARGGVDVKVESRSPAGARGAHLAPGVAVIEPGAGIGAT